MNKKLLFVGAAFVIIIVAVVMLLQRQSVSSPGPTPQPTLAPPAPAGIFTQPPNVTFSFAAPLSIPASLPSYTFQPVSLSSVEQVAAKAATTLNLGATPSAITRGGSYAKTWSRLNEASLTVTQTNERITLSFRQVKSIRPPVVIAPDAAAQQFLLALIPPTANLSVRAAGTTSGPFDGLFVLDSPAPTSFKNYFYSYALGTYPLITADLSITPVSVIADSGGIIRFATIAPPPASFQAGASLTLLTADQVLASLTARRGTLLDTHDPQTPDQGAVPDFSKFIIEDIKIVYAPKENLLFPALYMTGTGSAAGGATQKATIFLWLIPEGTSFQP